MFLFCWIFIVGCNSLEIRVALDGIWFGVNRGSCKMLHYIGMFFGNLFGSGEKKPSVNETSKPVPLWKLWFVWVFLVVFACLFALLAFVSLTLQKPIVLSDISTTQSIQANGLWASLDADNYKIRAHIGTDRIAPGQFSYKYRDADVFLIDVLSDSGSFLYTMFMMTDRVTFEADKPDLFGQCWALRESMLSVSPESDIYIVQAYLLDKGQTMFSYVGTVVLDIGGCAMWCWLLWFLPRRIKKRNAEIVAYKEKMHNDEM